MAAQQLRSTSLGAGAVMAVLLLAALAPTAEAHGIMIQPRSRNWKAYLDWNFNYAHGLSMGGALL